MLGCCSFKEDVIGFLTNYYGLIETSGFRSFRLVYLFTGLNLSRCVLHIEKWRHSRLQDTQFPPSFQDIFEDSAELALKMDQM